MKHLAIAAAFGLFALASAHAQEKMQWKRDYRAALKEGKKKNKYIVLHFMGSN